CCKRESVVELVAKDQVGSSAVHLRAVQLPAYPCGVTGLGQQLLTEPTEQAPGLGVPLSARTQRTAVRPEPRQPCSERLVESGVGQLLRSGSRAFRAFAISRRVGEVHRKVPQGPDTFFGVLDGADRGDAELDVVLTQQRDREFECV